LVDSDRGRRRAIERETDLVQAIARKQREHPESFRRCVLVVLSHAKDPASSVRILSKIPRDLAPLFAEIAVLCEGAEEAPAPETALELGLANLRWRANPRRYGHGGRRKIAFEYALEHGFDEILLVDEDDADAAAHLAAVWSLAALEGAQVVVGAPADAKLEKSFNAFLLRRLLGLQLSSFGASVRLYACDVLRRIPYALDSDEERFDTELLIQCRALGVAIRDVRLPIGGARAGSIGAAIDYRLHQLHVHRNGAFLVDRDVHYTLKHSPFGSHMQVLDAIQPGSRVLDLGCSQGLLAKSLRAKGVRIVGVDIGPAERVSRELEAYHRRDLEEALEIPEERVFDYVVMSDVIEHVKEREQLLRSARRYLKPNGRLLISTPNIAIWFYRLSLLAGRFEYGPRGVLDETHVHLYTRSTFRREVERGGFRILAERVTSLPFEVVFESTGQSRTVAALSRFYYWLARLYPKMFAYQFLLEAEVTTLLDPEPGAGER
jgi:methionine biosynthesis protein MetW